MKTSLTLEISPVPLSLYVRNAEKVVLDSDTAIVLQPSNTHTFFDTKVLEIICKPRG